MIEKIKIDFPSRLDPGQAITFIDALLKQPESKHYVFDFKNLNWVEPFALLYVSYHIAVYRSSRPEIRFDAVNFQIKNAHLYAAHMGFFKSFGLDFGKKPGEANGGNHYVPIKIFDISRFEQESIDEGLEVGDVLEKHAGRLSRILTREDDGDLVETLEFSLREMFRNVVEHSGAKRIGFCAQYYPKLKKVELAVLDNGIGVTQSLKANPYLQIETDKDALNYSLLPGVSGKAFKGAPKQRKGFWSNSGFGLFMTSELCRNGGSFFICSGTAGVFLKNYSKRNVQANLQGTSLRLVFNTSEIDAVKEALASYREKGQKVASQIKGAIITPSMASTMLSRDFK